MDITGSWNKRNGSLNDNNAVDVVKGKNVTQEELKETYIIKSKQGFIRKTMAVILTLIMWGYTVVAFYLFIGGILNYNDKYLSVIKMSLNIENYDIRIRVFLTLICFLGSLLILFLWRYYNLKRFGKLNRRTYPEVTNDEEMLTLGLVSKEDYKILQNKKVIIFEKNPIKDL